MISRIYVILITGFMLTVIIVGIWITKFVSENKTVDYNKGQPTYPKDNKYAIGKNITGEKLFNQYCLDCHDMDAKDANSLRGIEKRQSRESTIKFIKNSQAMIKSGDLYYKKLNEDYGGMLMPSFEFLTNAQIDSILIYIDYKNRNRQH